MQLTAQQTATNFNPAVAKDVDDLYNITQQIKLLTKQADAIKQRYKHMQNATLYSATHAMSITTSTRTTFDSKAFKQADALTYAQYTRTSDVVTVEVNAIK